MKSMKLKLTKKLIITAAVLGIIAISTTTMFAGTTYTYPTNATIVGDFSYVRDSNGSIIPGKRVDIGDKITIMDVSYSKKLAQVEYPTPSGIQKGYYISVANNISYTNQDKWKNGSTPEIVYNSDGKTKIATIDPRQTATPLYSVQVANKTMYHIVFNYNGGKNNMSGYVYYAGTSTQPTPSSVPTVKTAMSYALYKSSGGKITCGYDGYVELKKKYGYRHEGIDFAKGSGASVYSLVDGEVINVVEGSSAKLSTIAIRTTDGRTIIYLHTDPAISKGKIIKGTKLGTESSRGADGVIHTHVEMRIGNWTGAAISKNKVQDNPNPNSYWESQGYIVN